MVDYLFKEYNFKCIDVRKFINIMSKEYGIEDTEPDIPKVVSINKDYVNKLLFNLECIQEFLMERDYKETRKVFERIIKENDFDDPEEIASNIHKVINNKIIGSFTKVKKNDRRFLEKYILDAGYEKMKISVESRINEFAIYFDKVYKEVQDNKSFDRLIKSVDRYPYILKYDNDGDIEELCLKGECIYYSMK